MRAASNQTNAAYMTHVPQTKSGDARSVAPRLPIEITDRG